MYLPSLATSTLITFPSSVFNELISCQSSALQILTVWSNPEDARYNPLFDILAGFGLSSLSPFMSTSSFGGLLVPFVNCISSCERNHRTSDTEDLCAGMLYETFRARRSHIRMESSPEPAATWYLKGVLVNGVLPLVRIDCLPVWREIQGENLAYMSVQDHGRATCTNIPYPSDRIETTINRGGLSQMISFKSGKLTRRPPAHHRLGTRAQILLSSDLLATRFPFSSPRPTDAKCHHMTLIQCSCQTDGTLFDKRGLRGLQMSPATFRWRKANKRHILAMNPKERT